MFSFSFRGRHFEHFSFSFLDNSQNVSSDKNFHKFNFSVYFSFFFFFFGLCDWTGSHSSVLSSLCLSLATIFYFLFHHFVCAMHFCAHAHVHKHFYMHSLVMFVPFDIYNIFDPVSLKYWYVLHISLIIYLTFFFSCTQAPSFLLSPFSITTVLLLFCCLTLFLSYCAALPTYFCDLNVMPFTTEWPLCHMSLSLCLSCLMAAVMMTWFLVLLSEKAWIGQGRISSDSVFSHLSLNTFSSLS